MDRDEVIGGMVLFIFGAVTAALSLRMPVETFRMPGTGMFPLLLGILLMVLSGLFVLKLIYLSKKTVLKKKLSSIGHLFPPQLLLFFGAMTLATVFFSPLGYPLTSFLLMMALLRIL